MTVTTVQPRLHVGSDTFAFSAAQYFPGNHSYVWTGTSLDWSSAPVFADLHGRRADSGDTLEGTPTSFAFDACRRGQHAPVSPMPAWCWTSLTATWTKPDLNGGPEITGYDLQYREGTTGDWEDFAHTGTATTTTITGLTADTSYQVQVRAENGETDSDWSDPSDAVKTNAEMSTPTCTLNTGDLWCGVVTVGAINTEVDGFKAMVGDLSDKTFSVGTGNYTIDQVTVDNSTATNPESLLFSLTGALTDVDKAKLVLHIGSDTFAFENAQYFGSVHSYLWNSTGLDWSSETSVTLRLRANTAPVFSTATATREVEENSAVGTSVGAVVTATDADNDTLTYSLEGTDATSFEIDSGTGQIKTVTGVTYDHEATQNTYAVTVKADDGNGGTDTIAVTIDVTDADEKSAKPDKPVLAAVSGSSTSLTATWTKPDLNGGPDITGYDLQYKVNTATTWEDFTHTGTAVTTTITGLTADTSYQVRVQAKNGETDSDWSDPSDAVSTNAATETDATLSALSVTHAGGSVALRPAFAPGTTEYRASVANPVDEVTVTATANVAEATLAYLDGDGAAIADADTNTPGREVALEVGEETVVRVKVTAADGDAMRTYEVTVTRRAVDAPGAEGELRLTDEEPYADEVNDRHGGTAGRVEVSHAGAWGTVCSDGIRDSKKDKTFSTFDYDTNGDVILDADGNPQQFDKVNEAAALICKAMDYDDGEYHMKYGKFRPGQAEAGHQDADYWSPHSSYPADGPTPIWLDDLRCVAGESALGTDPLPGAMSQCSYAGWGLHNCTHKEDAVVRCWNNDPGGAGLKSLKGRFVSPPERHDGTNRVKVRVAFSEPVEESPENVGAHGVEVEGGEVTSVSPVGGDAPDGAGTRSAGGRNAGGEDREVVWEFEIEPDSDGDLTVTLEAGRPCGEPGAICTADGRALSEGISTTVEGPEAPPPLTASFEGMPAAHDGAGAFRFRVAFSENIGISYRSLREDAFTVSGGRVTRGRRVDDRRDLFEMTVEPDGEGEVTVTLPAGRECGVSGAICTKGENRRQLTNAPTATVAGPAVESGPAGLTARFARVPSEHDGTTAFKLRIAFSETIRMSGRRLRSDVVAVSGGRATRAGRVNRRKDLWKLKVRPDSLADVTVTLAAGAACDSPEAVCTKGEPRRRLTNTISATVRGPVAVSVADARAREGEDETIDFAVSLSRAASGPVSVTWATADGTATAGSDYTRASGKLRFAPGETEKTISVPVLDDAHDEGEETMQLRLSAASGAAIADGVATGTIENSDPMPHAWLSRFGRTLAGQVVDALGRRMEGGGAGTHVRVGGMQFDASGAFVEAGDEDEPRLATDTIGWTDPAHASSGMTGRELLLGSSFALGAGGANGTPAWTGWGRFATHGFEADVDGTRLDGNVTTGFVGADMARDGWLAGIALSYSTGDGDFSLIEGDDEGSVENSLTALYPYAKLGLGEKVDVWGLAGLGSGDLTLTLEADAHRATDERYTTDIDMRMGALGVRGEVVSPKAPGGFAVNVKSDAFWVRMDSDAVASEDGNLHASQTDASRVRLVLEGSRAVELDEGTLTPSLELGLRHDGGDAETGTGLEAGAGLRYAAGALTIGAQVRTLVAHEASGYEEWGVSGSVRLDPGASGRGLSLKLAPVFGAPSSGVEHLWSARDAGGLVGTEDFEAGRRLEAELGYGIALSGTRGLLIPYTALSWRQGGARTHRTGARWQLARAAALGLEWTHEPGTGAKPPANALMLRTQVRW